jgi:hypothetical protein
MISGGSAGFRMMMALPFLAPPFHRAGCGAGELVDVLSRARAGRFARHGSHNFAIRHRLHTAHGSNHRDGRLATAGDHIDVHFALADVFHQVNRRHTKRADSGRGQIDH